MQETWVQSQIGKIPWRRKWQPTPVFLPGEFHGQRGLVGSSPWDHKQSDVTELLALWSMITRKIQNQVTFRSVTQSCPTVCDPHEHMGPYQASLSLTLSCSLLKLISTQSVMPSNHLILCHPLLLCFLSFLASGSFPMSQVFKTDGQSVGASASVLPMNIQG